MSIHRRLARLESQARPKANGPVLSDHEYQMTRELQRRMNLPLPDEATQAERAECLALLQVAQERLRASQNRDISGVNSVASFAAEIHRKYRD